MEPACLRHTELPGTSKLFADFCYHFDRVAPFYVYDPLVPESYACAAAQIAYPEDRRRAMVRALAAQNGDNPLLARFAKPGTAAVVTGQQVGLFTGPAYTVYKALTAAKLAAELTARGTEAVPIFWLATEDHDFPEVATAWTYGGGRRPVSLDVAAPVELAGRPRPVGGIPLEAPPVDQLHSALHGLPFADEVLDLVSRAYRPGATMGAAFRALLLRVLGKVGVLTIDPLDPAVRAIGAPLLARALKAAPELKAALLDRSRKLTDAGYHAQVLIEPKTSLFFLLADGERQTLRMADADFAALEDRAAAISPNALLRPVWQDYLLPTVAYVGGPGELAYFAQSHVLYERLLGRMPVVMARSGFTLVDAHSAKLLKRHRLNLTDTFVREDLLRDRIAKSLVPEALSQSFTDTAKEIETRLVRLQSEVEAFDPTLGTALSKSRAKIAYQVEKTRRKVERETLRRDARAGADADALTAAFYPHRHLQERLYSSLPFLAEHGMDLAERLYGLVQLDCPDHRVVYL